MWQMFSMWPSLMRLQKSSKLPVSRPRSRSETCGVLATMQKLITFSPIRTLRAGLRACRVKAAGALLIRSSTKAGSKRTRVPTGSTAQPASLRIALASSSRKFMPTSASTLSEA